jgi:N-sulfoglucosamine sulfohydrolase
VRDPDVYPLERLIDASDLALAISPENREALEAMLTDKDSGVRYWGSVGLFLLRDQAADSKPALHRALADDCHEVVAMAAWALYQLGEKETARKTLRSLLENNSYAALKVANIIDWIGEGYDYYKDALAACETSVQSSYLGRIKESVLGSAKPSKPKKRQGK